MSKFFMSEYFIAATQNYYIQATMALAPNSSQSVNAEALIARMERMNSRLKDKTAITVKASPIHPDADLLKLRDEFEAHWWREVNAWIALRRLNTPEAAEYARLTRESTAEVVRRMDAIGAVTRDGLAVKARIARWRRYGANLDGPTRDGGEDFGAFQLEDFDEAA